MLKCQVTNFSYGIPGESKCYQCSEEKHFNSIVERFQHHFEYHGELVVNFQNWNLRLPIRFVSFAKFIYGLTNIWPILEN